METEKSYSEELEHIGNADDSYFEDFLFQPLFSDFEDNYYENSFAKDELDESVRCLKRKYSNFFDFIDAIEIYNKFMDKLIEKYGSAKTIANGVEEGWLDEYVPPKPKLKNNRRNREFLNAGIIPPRPLVKRAAEKGTYYEMASKMYSENGEEIDSVIETKLDKITKKMLRKVDSDVSARNRRRNMYRSASQNSGADYIIEYLNAASKGQYDIKGKYEDRSIMDIIREEEEFNSLPEAIRREKYEAPTRRIVNNRLSDPETELQKELYMDLYNSGIDIFSKGFSKNLNRSAIKMVRGSVGSLEPLTKKDRKKLKKEQKKEAQIFENRRASDKKMHEVLLGNRFNITDDKGSLRMRLSDIGRDRG